MSTALPPDEPGDTEHAASPADEPTRVGGISADEPTRVSGGPAEAAAPLDVEGVLIEGYHLLEEIHRGGQGVVYRAIQLGTKRQVALKVLLEGPFASRSTHRRFEREIELAASLRHPNIVTILDSGVSHGRYYFAMEHIDGQRLDRYLAQVRPSLKDTLHLFASICDAINFAHQRGVIHRDLKPPNILVDNDGEPRVLDFGLAKPAQPVDAEEPTVRALSSAGELLGTVAYMSPEQTLGSLDVDVRSDVYSLGVVFYEAMLGQLPYSVEGPLGEVLTRIAESDPRPPRAVRDRSRFGHFVNDELETILLKSLEKHPVRRYQTAGELARDLRHLLRGEPVEAKRASGLYMLRKTLKRYRLQAAAAAAVLLTMVIFLVGFAFLWSSEREARERANTHQTQAIQRAIEARQAQRELEHALVRQTLQRGELAQARGDLVAARDLYWDAYWNAYHDAPSPATLWALRQYYLQTGDAGAGVLYFQRHGPMALSPSGRLAAVCETPDAITIRQVATGRTLGWLLAPGPVTVVHIDDRGILSAAAPDWARLWNVGSLVPDISAELPDDFDSAVLAVRAVSEGRRLLLVGPERLVCFAGPEGAPVGTAELFGDPTGSVTYAPRLDQLAVATSQEVQLVSILPDGQLRTEPSSSTPSPPLAVRFVDDELVALTADAAYRSPAGGPGPRMWSYFAAVPPDWERQLFDVRRAAGTLAFGLRAGSMAAVGLFRNGRAETPRSVTAGGLQDLRLSPDGSAVITVDERGTVTRWLSPRSRQSGARILAQPPTAWAFAEDGSSVLLANGPRRVFAYAPQRTPRPERIPVRRFLSFLPGQEAEDVILAVSSQGMHTVACTGRAINLRDAGTGSVYTATWNDLKAPLLTHAAITGDGRLLAFCAQTQVGDRQQISFWKWQPRTPVGRSSDLAELLPAAGESVAFVGSVVRHLAFIPGTHRLLVARSNGDLLLLAADARARPASQPPAPWMHLDSRPTTLSFDRSGDKLAVACEDGFVHVLATGAEDTLARLHVDQPVHILDFDPSGNVLLICTTDGAVSLYDLGTAERIAQLSMPGEQTQPFAMWIGDDDTLLLASDNDLREHRYNETDNLIARNRAYALQRTVARHLADGDFAAAWEEAAALRKNDFTLARSTHETILVTTLHHSGYDIPENWIAAAMADAPAHALLRLGHAAYEGERYGQAGTCLRQARASLGTDVDAYTALRIAQCDYVAGNYEQAAEEFARLLERPDLDAAHIPTVQLQLVATLVLADKLSQARAVTFRIGSVRRRSPSYDVVATNSARDIARFLTGLESESLLAAGVQRLLAEFAGESLQFHDDDPFFKGELARHRGDPAEAAAQYQRCIDLARDAWPANWARFRLLQLSPVAP